MFTSKLNPEEMLSRSEQSSSASPRFPMSLIRSYNHIFNPRDISSYYHLAMLAENPLRNELSSRKVTEGPANSSTSVAPTDYRDWGKRSLVHAPTMTTCIPSRECHISGILNKRHRGEKKAIPEEQKDGKYFERRKRNNEAAKRSRDARKLREDRIAFRASILEQENAILKSQVFSLRDEISTLRQMIFPGPAAGLPLSSN